VKSVPEDSKANTFLVSTSSKVLGYSKNQVSSRNLVFPAGKYTKTFGQELKPPAGFLSSTKCSGLMRNSEVADFRAPHNALNIG
jgi:hypothetical protein